MPELQIGDARAPDRNGNEHEIIIDLDACSASVTCFAPGVHYTALSLMTDEDDSRLVKPLIKAAYRLKPWPCLADPRER